ncbi:MAG: sulfatase family protein [Candidatus Zipacnadales bacterium]
MGDLPVSRRTFCSTLLGGPAAVRLSTGLIRQRARPNIVLITTDDMGIQLGCYGDKRARTPYLDRLAEEGVLFEQAYVTQASCRPSRSSMFTGLYPHQNGQIGLSHRHYSMHEGMVTLPALLKGAGYPTGVIGKVHVAPEVALPFDMPSPLKTGETREVARVAEAAATFIREDPDIPFFLMVNYFDPHRPHADQIAGLPVDPLTAADVVPLPFQGIDTPEVLAEVASYYNCNTRADAGIGMLMERVEQAGVADNTLVIVLGDNGPPFTRAKTTCYEAGVRTPFIVRWPNRAQAGLRSQALISAVDILPTVCEAAGIDHPQDLAGQSLVPLLTGEEKGWRCMLATEYNSHSEGGFFPRRTIRDDRYKLILNLLPDRPNPILGVNGCLAWAASRDTRYDGTKIREVFDRHAHPPAVELYDIQEDPNEFHNLAGEAATAEIEQRLLSELTAWRMQTNDPLLDEEFLTKLAKWHDEKQWEQQGTLFLKRL